MLTDLKRGADIDKTQPRKNEKQPRPNQVLGVFGELPKYAALFMCHIFHVNFSRSEPTLPYISVVRQGFERTQMEQP